jgi:hypothetical protein
MGRLKKGEHGDRHMTRGEQCRGEGLGERSGPIRGQHHRLAGQSVPDNAAHDGERCEWQPGGREHEPQRAGTPTRVEHRERQGHRNKGGSRRRTGLADEQEPEAAVAKRALEPVPDHAVIL